MRSVPARRPRGGRPALRGASCRLVASAALRAAERDVMKGSLRLQSEIRREISGFVDPGFVRALHRRDHRRAIFTLAHVWAAIAVTFWLAGHVLALPLVLAVPCGLVLSLFMATRINALNVQVHEGAHAALAENRRLNDFLTNWVAGYAILFDADSYRALHNKHHQKLNEPSDPDRPLYEIEPGLGSLVRGFLADLCWLSIARRARVYAEQATKGGGRGAVPPGGGPRHLAGKAAMNAMLLGVQVLAWGPLAGAFVYFAFWVVPLFSFYPAIIRLRIIAEHFAPEIMGRADGQDVFVARTSVCGPLEHYLFGAQMDYHFEHHLYPGVPYANLHALHDALCRARFFDESRRVVRSRALSGGYFHFWRELLKSDWVRNRGGELVVSGR